MTLRRQLLLPLVFVLVGCAAPSAQPTATPASTPSPTPLVETPSATPSGLAPDVEIVATLQTLPGYGFAWAPDGSRLAFFSADGLQVAEAPSFEPRAVAEGFSGVTLLGGNTGPLWSLQGDRIAFTAPTTLPGEDWQPLSVWLIKADGTDLLDLLPGENAVLSVSTAKILIEWLDEGTLAFGEHVGTGVDALYLLNVDSGELTPVAVTEDSIFGFMCGTVYYFSPEDKETVASECWGRGLPEITLLDLDSGLSKELPGEWEAFEDWAPDGSAFLFTRWESEIGEEPSPIVSQPVDLYLWDLQEDEARLLAPNASWASWSPDGRTAAFYLFGEPQLDSKGRLTGTDFEPGWGTRISLGLLDLESRKLLARIPVFSRFIISTDYNAYWGWFSERRPVWSPDGRQVIFWRTDGTLMLATADGSEVKILATTQAQVSSARWSSDGEFLALATEGEPATLWIVKAP